MAGVVIVPTASFTARPDDTAFMAHGACRESDPDLFYPTGDSVKADIARAKQICAVCPVLWECGKWAHETGQDFGVWGGKTADERRAMARRARQQTGHDDSDGGHGDE